MKSNKESVKKMKYKGITIDESVKFHNKDGTIHKGTKDALDKLVFRLTIENHKVLSKYSGIHSELIIDFNCEHSPVTMRAGNYIQGNNCIKCFRESELNKGYLKLLERMKENNHELKSKYNGALKNILIDFKCGHNPKWTRAKHYMDNIVTVQNAQNEILKVLEII